MDDLEKRVVYLEVKSKQRDELEAKILADLEAIKEATLSNTKLLSSWKGGLAVLGVVGTILAMFITWGLDLVK
jgi:flagellar motor component MotA